MLVRHNKTVSILHMVRIFVVMEVEEAVLACRLSVQEPCHHFSEEHVRYPFQFWRWSSSLTHCSGVNVWYGNKYWATRVKRAFIVLFGNLLVLATIHWRGTARPIWKFVSSACSILQLSLGTWANTFSQSSIKDPAILHKFEPGVQIVLPDLSLEL